MDIIAKRVCTLCGEPKPATCEYFSKSKHGKYGLKPACKICVNLAYKVAKEGTPQGQKAKVANSLFEQGLRGCTKCFEVKALNSENFRPRKKNKGGLDSICRECDRAADRTRYAANPRKGKQKRKDYAERYPERVKATRKLYRENNRDEVDLRRKEWYLKNREHALAYAVEWAKANPEKRREKARRWWRANPEKAQQAGRTSYARRKKALGKHTNADVKLQFALQKERCYWCGKKLKASGKGRYHVDHIVALSIGGTNGPDNICCACPTCNLSKGAKTPLEFAGRLF